MEPIKPPTVSAPDEHIKLLRTVCVGATDDEIAHLMYLANAYGLDPIKKEIYLTKFNGRASYITGKDGYLKIANNHPDFDGLEADAVYEGDKLIRREDRSIFMEYGDSHLKFDRTKIVGAYCNVWRKNRSIAASAYVSWKDYAKESPIWKTYPNAMIIKSAEKMALQRAFVITGLGAKEEEPLDDAE